MTNATNFVAQVKEKKKPFERGLSEITGLPEQHFKINEVASLFSIAAATVALHELESGSLAGRMSFLELSATTTKSVMPEGARKSTIHKVWGRSKSIKTLDDFHWGDLREIANYLSVEMVALVPIFESVDTVRHELARYLSNLARSGNMPDTLFTSEDAASANVKVDSGAPESASTASEQANTPGMDPTPSKTDVSAAQPKKVSAIKRRVSPRKELRRDKLSKDATEGGLLNPQAGP